MKPDWSRRVPSSFAACFGRRGAAPVPALEPDLLAADLVRRSRRFAASAPAMPLAQRLPALASAAGAAAALLLAAVLALHPLAGVGGTAAWFLQAFVIIALAACWQVRGAVAGCSSAWALACSWKASGTTGRASPIRSRAAC